MKITGRTWMCIVLIALSVGVILTARTWPLKAAIFPIFVAVFVLVLAAIEIFLALFLKQTAKETSTLDFKLADAETLEIDEKTARKRVTVFFAWTFFFFLLILLLGFPLAIPTFFIIFLRFYGKESWGMTILLAAVAWGSFYGLFIYLLHVPFSEGWIFTLLKLLGLWE